MFSSLDMPVTKNQISAKNFLLLLQLKKKEGNLASSLLFELKQQQQTLAEIWFSVHIWFLVTGRCNEKNIEVD